jgi:hypothetical protein
METKQENKSETWLDHESGVVFGLCRHGEYWIWDTKTLIHADCYSRGVDNSCNETPGDTGLLKKSREIYPNAKRIS